MNGTLFSSLRLTLLAVVLAGCSSLGTRLATAPAPLASAARADICAGKDPGAEAASKQGVSARYPNNPYVGKDSYVKVGIDQGASLYTLTPSGTPGFAVEETTLRDAGGSWERYYALVQVTTDPGTDEHGAPRQRRDKVRQFEVTEALCVARGPALANPQFGAGGGVQYYVVEADAGKLKPGAVLRITDWLPAGSNPR